jgi:hypothetical protein
MAEAAYEGAQAFDRLEQLGVTVADLEFALRGGDAEARTYTELDPPSTPGIGRWGRTNRFLRERLLPKGWKYDNPRNLPRTIDPTGAYTIVATTGDDSTGRAHAVPTTKYAKGIATQEAVLANEQLAFDLPELQVGEALAEVVASQADPVTTWLLLYNVTDEGIRAELSCPASITKQGFVDAWSERIILPPMAFDEPDDGDGGGEDGEGIDVPIERR